MQESKLFNISYGDADLAGPLPAASVDGLRHPGRSSRTPSTRPASSTTRWSRCPNYTDLPLTQAAQKVQRSAYPDAYARHENKPCRRAPRSPAVPRPR
ncbi:hypothetical protein ACU686_32430 [Yinghuangia aomiensis]